MSLIMNISILNTIMIGTVPLYMQMLASITITPQHHFIATPGGEGM